MQIRIGFIGALAAGLLAAGSGHAQGLSAKVDYAKPDAWLCLPGRVDACIVDQSATVVSASGSMRREDFRPSSKTPTIDCFYVYPTVSRDPGVFSDMTPNAEERSVISTQFARFAASCRQFAPLYRQFTLTALTAAMQDGGRGASLPASSGRAGASSGGIVGMGGAYADVLDAWTYYMTNLNQGRGVVLIGHSQGSSQLMRLIADEIDGRPAQRQLVSAILLGPPGGVQVPPGKDAGGTFKSIPLCRKDTQTGCVITYASFRDASPPGAGSLFGTPGQILGQETVTACTNPANLKTGKGQPDSYFTAARAPDPNTGQPLSWVDSFQPVGTPFVHAPGFVTTECVSRGGYSYLSVHVNANPKDKRTDTLSGDVIQNGEINAGWGLHLIDMHLSMGDLVDIVAKQGRSWKPARK